MNAMDYSAPAAGGEASTHVLTIAIPTRNRVNRLRALLHSLEPVLALDGVQCLVLDNASTDSTWQLRDVFGSAVEWERNERNVGLEGNITKALLAGTGRYKWLLSDHMVVTDVSAIAELIRILGSQPEVDIGCVGIREYEAVRTGTIIEPAGGLTRRELTRFCFNLSNISSLLVRQKFVFENLRHVAAFATYAYPHLGLLCGIRADSRCLHARAATAFQRADGFAPAEVAASYNTFRCRFLGMPSAFGAINEAQRQAEHGGVGPLETFPASIREFRRNLVREMARVTMFPNDMVSSSDFWDLLKVSRGVSRLGLACLLPFFLTRKGIGPVLRVIFRLVSPGKYRRLSPTV